MFVHISFFVEIFYYKFSVSFDFLPWEETWSKGTKWACAEGRGIVRLDKRRPSHFIFVPWWNF